MEPKERPLTVQEMSAMGGRARAKGLTKKRRSEIAREAAKKRWAKKVAGKEKPSDER